MAYIRAGVTIEELAFLGRWKSSVVISYTEDALQEVSANSHAIICGAGEAKEKKRLRAPSTPLPLPGEAAPPRWQTSNLLQKATRKWRIYAWKRRRRCGRLVLQSPTS